MTYTHIFPVQLCAMVTESNSVFMLICISCITFRFLPQTPKKRFKHQILLSRYSISIQFDVYFKCVFTLQAKKMNV